MAAVAACIVAGEIILLMKIPSMGFIYLPLACFLAGAIAFIPYSEYRSAQRARMSQGHRPSPELVASKLQRLQPQLRIPALIPLGLAAATSVVLLLMTPWSWGDRIAPIAMMLAALLFFAQFLKERRILNSYAPTLGRVIAFKRKRRGRTATYEYESPVGVVKGMGGSLVGFEVGMAVPVLYNVFKPDESLPVPDFLFYRIRAELT